jgi:hypothetical protein
VYTGRGPVCGTIKRRTGGWGAAGFGGSGGVTAAGRASTLRSTITGAGGFGSTRAGSGGVMRRGAGFGSSTGADFATTFSLGTSSGGAGGAAGGAAGVTADLGIARPTFGGTLLTAGGATFAIAGLSGSGAWVFFKARRTSPGLDIFEKSNFGLISSVLAAFFSDTPVREPRRCLRTRAASSSSSELECVFFSVTPTSGNTSRIALLLTSSSLAKSLIRTFDIR